MPIGKIESSAMKIRSYLAILVLVALVGGNGVRYLLSEKFASVSEQSQATAHTLLWRKDFQRTSADIRQYLISADLILGSQETYLANGALGKGKLIVNELTEIAKNNQLLHSTTQLTDSASDISRINDFIQQAATSDSASREQELQVLLNQYDQLAFNLSHRLQKLVLKIDNAIALQNNHLKEVQASMASDSLAIQVGFSLLVILSWYWASRTICKPLQQLRNEANSLESGKQFNGVDFGPTEIRQLSDNFASMTQTLSFQASRDPLTKLYNRRAFGRAMTEFLAEAEEEQICHALCFIDLDHFKPINDTCGHTAGDEILVHVAHVLTHQVRTCDIVARLGGDEFAILLHDCPVIEAQAIANTIRDTIRNFKYRWEDQIFRIGASIGITQIDGKSGLIEDMLNAADIACMQAKELGRDVVITFDSCADLLAQKRLDAISVNQIKSALQEDRFELYRQEIVPLQPSFCQGRHYEILLRMRDEHGNLISPATFMPLVERYRLGTQIDRWVVSTAIEWLHNNPQELAELTMCSLNLSGQSVGCEDTREFITDKLRHNQFPAHKLCFEITETAAIASLECANALIADLKQYGCRFALDDFGSGLSSFAYLKNLQVDFVKIDGAFVKDMLHSASDIATVRAINDVAKSNGKQTIAEFVEDEKIADALRELRINFAQGYHFDKPSPIEPDVDYQRVKIG